MTEVLYHCMPKMCGCKDSFPCSFTRLDEEYVSRTRNHKCKIAIEKMFMVNVETQKQVEIIEQMEW